VTAEIGILNRIGVAMAADSAVTIGPEANKIWASADKLFHLSGSAPVGIMVYGNANFVGIPWETVVKEFRKELEDKRFDRLEEYAERFFRFLGSNRTLFPEASQDQKVEASIRSFFSHVRNEMESRLTAEIEQRGPLEDGEIAPIISEVISKLLRLVRGRPALKGFGKRTVAEIRKRYASIVRDARTHVFRDLPISASTSRKIGSLATEVLSRHYFSS
jgi:hypothetical protein